MPRYHHICLYTIVWTMMMLLLIVVMNILMMMMRMRMMIIMKILLGVVGGLIGLLVLPEHQFPSLLNIILLCNNYDQDKD